MSEFTDALEARMASRARPRENKPTFKYVTLPTGSNFRDYYPITDDNTLKQKTEPRKISNKFVTRPLNINGKLSTYEKDLLRSERRLAVLNDIEKATESAGNYYQFVQNLGYRASSVPLFEQVANITLENDQVCINEIPEDQQEDDIKPETE